jgi:ArsR family transcriptional regulator, arsenate/arsenite/antimonite-responsive transcriptional repressor
MKEFMAVAKALADENRTRVLMFLRDGELCVCRIVEMLALAPSTVSKHLNVLYQAGLVESRKEGRWIYYRLPERPSGRRRQAPQSRAEDGPGATLLPLSIGRGK